ncbi:MAG: hypothetical protein OCD02_11365 [Spirochaetaceae bacterium]
MIKYEYQTVIKITPDYARSKTIGENKMTDAEIMQDINKHMKDKGITRSELKNEDYGEFEKRYALSKARKSYLKKILIEGTNADIDDLFTGKRSIHSVMKHLEKPKKLNAFTKIKEHFGRKRSCNAIITTKDLALVKFHEPRITTTKGLVLVKEHTNSEAIKLLLKRFQNSTNQNSKEILIYAEIFYDLQINRLITLLEYKEYIAILKEKINSIQFNYPKDKTSFHNKFEKFKLVVRLDSQEDRYSIFQMMKLK